MAYEIPGFKIGTLRAGEDLSTKQFTFVKLNSSGQVVAVSATSDRAIGILQNTPGSLVVADVMANGISKLVGGGSLAAGVPVCTDAAGKGSTFAYGSTGTAVYALGQVLEGNTAANGMVTVAFDCLNPARGA